MTFEGFLAFAAASVVLMLIPGPSVMLAIGVSLRHGFRTAMANVLGATTAVAVQVAVLSIGLTPLLLFASTWFEWVRWAGVIYLVYLGIVQMRGGRNGSGGAIAPESRDRLSRRAFLHGFAVSALNPKSLLFFAAILPQFLDASTGPAGQLIVMGATLVVTALVTTTLWAWFAERARRMLRGSRADVWRDRTSGTVMILAGLALAAAKR